SSYGRLRGGTDLASPLTDALAREADLQGRRVLDVGCGTGRMLRELVDRYEVEPVGLDRAPEMIHEAQRLLRDDAELQVGLAEAIALADADVEGAVMTLVAQHLDRPVAFREIHRVLAPEGRLAVASTDPEALGSLWMAPLFPSYVEIDSRRFPSGERLGAELTDAGFDGLRVVPFEIERTFDREAALAKLRGRAYSTFAFMSAEEHADGLARAERELPEMIEYTLRLLIAV